jgi:hypothetical protein
VKLAQIQINCFPSGLRRPTLTTPAFADQLPPPAHNHPQGKLYGQPIRPADPGATLFVGGFYATMPRIRCNIARKRP